jgi:hypothetical protein
MNNPATFTVTEADFQTGFAVVDTSGDSPTMQQNPYNCATLDATKRLQTHLATLGLHPVISMDYPMPGWSGNGPFQQEGPNGATGAGARVPYLDFTNAGTSALDHENAGGILVEYLKMGQALSDYNCGLWFAGDL